MGIRSDTMSLVTVFSSQVMLRVGANSDTLLPELNKTPRAVSQPLETEENGLVVGFPVIESHSSPIYSGSNWE